MNIDPTKLAPLQGLLKKPHVNSTCIWCSACVYVTDEAYFKLNDDGLSCVQKQENYNESMVDDAIASCPVNAISWQACDAEGNYTNGVTEHKDIV